MSAREMFEIAEVHVELFLLFESLRKRIRQKEGFALRIRIVMKDIRQIFLS